MLLLLSDGLSKALGVDPVIELDQQLARLDVLEVLHWHLDDIAAQLRSDDRDLPAHHGVFGTFDGAAERGQAPRIKHHQYADQGDTAEGDG